MELLKLTKGDKIYYFTNSLKAARAMNIYRSQFIYHYDNKGEIQGWKVETINNGMIDIEKLNVETINE